MEVNNNGGFVAGPGTLSLGIIGTAGTALGLLGGNGNLPFFGGGNRLTEAEAKIARLEAERYTDAAVMREREHSAAGDVLIASLTEKVNQLAVKNAEDIKALKAEFELRAEIERKQAKIDLLEAVNPLAAQLSATNTAVNGMQQVLAGITKIYVPSTSVCGPATGAAVAA